MNQAKIFFLILIFIFSVCYGASPIIPLTINILPADNIWNTPINALPVHAKSDTYINTIGKDKPVHPDFGSGLYNGAPIGIPFITVTGSQAKVSVTFTYDDESDVGPYPIPADAPIEGGSDSTGDRHVLVIDNDNGILYELYNAFPQADGSWQAGSGAIYSLSSNDLRPDTWTSADAAGLPVFPGLIRYDEVLQGAINHAIRFTTNQTKKEYVWPARHYASSLTDDKYPPMGQRFRLKSTFDSSSYSNDMKVIITALKTYGMILADNGSPWYISGAPDDRWDNDILNELKNIIGSDFEAVDTSSLMVSINSGQVNNFVDSTAPSVPTGLISSSITQSTLSLSWTASTDAIGVTGYKIYQDGVQIGTSATNSLSVTGLTAATNYSFTVSAYDSAANNSAISSSLAVTTLSATTPDTIAPSVPTNLTSAAITPTTFTLSWTASTDDVAVTGYKIFQDNVQIGTSTTTAYSVTGLTTATTYSFTVTAYDAAANNSSLSNALSVSSTSTPDTTAPSIPIDLVSASITTTTFTLTWTASSDAVGVTGYKIFQNDTQIGTSTSTTFAVTALIASTTYSFTVSAYDAAGNESAKSTALSVTTSASLDTIAPTVPTGLASSAITKTTFTLSWTSSTDAVGVTSYNIYNGGGLAGTSSTTSFDVIGLIAATTYSFTVSALDAAGNNSAQSSPLSVKTSATIETTDTTQPVDGNDNQNSGSNSSSGGGGGGGCTYAQNSSKENQIGFLLSMIFSLFIISILRKIKL